jgi:hypothetical protein
LTERVCHLLANQELPFCAPLSDWSVELAQWPLFA